MNSLISQAVLFMLVAIGVVGAGIVVLWDETLVLALFGMCFVLLRALRFKKHLGS